MSALRELRRRAEAGQSLPAIARELDVPLDLAEQMVGHWRDLGVLTVVGHLDHATPDRCAVPDRLKCGGCFFSRGCPSRTAN